MAKIGASLRNFRDRIKTSISLKTRNVLFFLAVFLVVVLALIIRLSPLIRDITLIKAFDPWIQWYNAEYLDTHTMYEYFNWVDYKSWYPEGYYRGFLRPGLTVTVVIFHRIFNFFGLPISLYDVCFYFPAFMGALTVLVMYFLGKEVLNRATGLFAAFFLAFNPGYLQRTTAGFFDNETIGVFATLMIFVFFLKAIRTGRFSQAVLGGVFLGYLSLSWGGYQFVYLVIPIISIILIFTNKYSENVLLTYAGVQGTGLLIFSVYTKFNYNNLFSSLDIGGIFFFSIILVFFHIIHTKKNEHPNFYYRLLNTIKWGIIPVILVLAIILWVAPEILPFNFGARFWTIINPLFREDVSLVASVAEQMPSSWSVFYYNTLIPLVLVPLGIYFCFKRLNAADIFVISFVILMYYFTGSMIRIILIFAPAASLAGAYGLASVLKIFGSFIGERKVGVSRKRKRQLKGTLGSSEVLVVYLLVGVLLYAQVAHTTNIAINQMSYAQITPGGFLHDWEESLTWMENNLQGTDVVVSWWDYGYWLTPIGNVTTVNDNATKNSTRIGLTGMAFMQTDELASVKALRRLHADYVLVYWGFLISQLGGDEGKWTWMVEICNDNYEKYKQMGWEEDNWADNAVFDLGEYVNETNGAMKDAWFESQLIKLLFGGEPTVDDGELHQLEQNYVDLINNRRDNDGDLWVSHVPDDGLYNSMIFIPTYFSRTHLVKLYKVDYTILDSSFIIQNPRVTDKGYATFKLKNTGNKELYIREVAVNDSNYPFFMADKHIEAGSDALVWVNTTNTDFQLDDVVQIEVTAQSEALFEREYIFSNSTSNFFVREAQEGEINIIKENSIVIQKDTTTVDLYLEIENTGDSIVILDRFYSNTDTLENRIDQEKITYLSGSAALAPAEKAFIHIRDATIDFSPIKEFNKIGVATPNDIYDEILFTSNAEDFSLSILRQDRIPSPEESAILSTNYRKHIPIDFNNSFAYTYDNGSIIFNMRIKNTGDVIFGLDSIYLGESLIEVDSDDYYTKSGFLNLESDEEDIIVIEIDTNDPGDAKYGLSGEINEEILICITGGFGEFGTVASDIGYIHTIKDEPDIKIIKDVQGVDSSIIYANETGQVLIKNTGNEVVTLSNIYVNNTLVSNTEYIYGDSSLGIQECAIITFDIPELLINKSNECIISVNTTTSIQTNETLNAIVDSKYYNIAIDDGGSSAYDSGSLTILIQNNGLFNVTVDSVYINGTYFSANEFTSDNGYEIGTGGTLELTISMSTIEANPEIGIINVDDILEFIVRTVEGAEDIHQETVK
ncbi:MAG: STT3 domain-containing protein [Candidatus Hermodarchaeota archaeon]